MQEKDLQAAPERPAETPQPEETPSAGTGPGNPAPEQATVTAEELLGGAEQPAGEQDARRADLKAILEAVVYVLNEPMPASQIADALGRETAEVEPVLRELAEETGRADRGIFIREVAGGYQMATKPEHHEVLRQFVRNLKQPLKLSQAALETLAVIAYKQPITLPEILDIRGVQGGGVLKTLIDRKLVTTAGRKQVIGKPILYKTTKDFLTQFGLKDVNELPSLKEFEEIRRQSMADEEIGPAQAELPIDEIPDDSDAAALAAMEAEPGDSDAGAVEIGALEIADPEPAETEMAAEEAAGSDPADKDA